MWFNHYAKTINNVGSSLWGNEQTLMCFAELPFLIHLRPDATKMCVATKVAENVMSGREGSTALKNSWCNLETYFNRRYSAEIWYTERNQHFMHVPWEGILQGFACSIPRDGYDHSSRQ